jgi:tRNA A58 N-methylase Trm61
MFFRFAVAFLLLACHVSAQTSTTPHREASRPYTGDLSVFEEKGRDQKLHVDRVMDVLGISPGKTVADIGAGSGWFTVRAAKRVTSSGQVFAVDINPEAVQYIRDRVRREKLQNVTAIESKPDDPLLAPGSIDAALFLKVYHEVQDPISLLTNLRSALKQNGKVGIIDRNGNAGNHGVQQATVISEMKNAGFKLAETYDFVKDDGMDYFLVFTPEPSN